uniref:Uncharacterized protein n=1 Tax=Lygus hesperus TaxID=30085 RepID=A0A146KSP2_LYGHE
MVGAQHSHHHHRRRRLQSPGQLSRTQNMVNKEADRCWQRTTTHSQRRMIQTQSVIEMREARVMLVRKTRVYTRVLTIVYTKTDITTHVNMKAEIRAKIRIDHQMSELHVFGIITVPVMRTVTTGIPDMTNITVKMLTGKQLSVESKMCTVML